MPLTPWRRSSRDDSGRGMPAGNVRAGFLAGRGRPGGTAGSPVTESRSAPARVLVRAIKAGRRKCRRPSVPRALVRHSARRRLRARRSGPAGNVPRRGKGRRTDPCRGAPAAATDRGRRSGANAGRRRHPARSGRAARIRRCRCRFMGELAREIAALRSPPATGLARAGAGDPRRRAQSNRSGNGSRGRPRPFNRDKAREMLQSDWLCDAGPMLRDCSELKVTEDDAPGSHDRTCSVHDSPDTRPLTLGKRVCVNFADVMCATNGCGKTFGLYKSPVNSPE